MSWTTPVDNYCERLAPSFWAEPVNAATNAAFLIAALVMLGQARAARDAGALALVAILALIGVGSFLFHTVAQRWAGLADVLPILAFILTYLWLATRRFYAAPAWAGALAVLAFFPIAMGTAALIRATVGSLNGSEGYAGVVVLIAAYAAGLARSAPATARGLAIGAGLLTLSLTARSLDAALCEAIPLGTHFLWHLLNGLTLGWMIHVLLAHSRTLAQRPARG